MTVLAAIAMVVISAGAGWADFRRGIIPPLAIMGVAIAGVVFASQLGAIAVFNNSVLSISILASGHAAWWTVDKLGKGPYFGRGDWNLMAAAALGLGGFGIWVAAVVALFSALVSVVFGRGGIGPYGPGTVTLGPFMAAGIGVGAYVLCAS